GGYRRTGRVDRPAHRIERAGAATPAAGWQSAQTDPAHRRPYSSQRNGPTHGHPRSARRNTPGQSARKPKPMRRQRRTKVVATLGPASSDHTVIRSLFEAGADVFRINMSHTAHDKMRELVTTIRAVEAECNRPIGILVDLQGPKLRLGSFKND